jgi:NADPH:quinone reductase-like Zn-dependent oxidoreductase
MLKNYDYECGVCDYIGEQLVEYEQRDQVTCRCGALLIRVEISGINHLKTAVDDRQQMGVFLKDGTRIPGSFGSERRNKYKR